MAQKSRSGSTQQVSWGPAAGLLTGCAATLIGIVMDLPPLTILYRTLVSGSVMCLLVMLCGIGWQLVTPAKEEDH